MPYAVRIKPSKVKEMGDTEKIWVNEKVDHYYVTAESRTAWNTREEIPSRVVKGLWEEIVWVGE